MKHKLSEPTMKQIPALHPYLFVLYTILAPLALNISEVPLVQIVRPILVSLAITAIVLLAIYFITKNWLRAAFLTTLLIFILLFYGHIFQQSQNWLTFGLWALILGTMGSSWVWKRIKGTERLTAFLNLAGVFTLIIPVLTIGIFIFRTPKHARLEPSPGVSDGQTIQLAGGSPDIYYIIVDGYGRADVLQGIYHFDNSDFLQYLDQRGFYVASSSQSNYMQTALSLTSSLNLGYLDSLATQMGMADSRAPLLESLQHSQVRSLLENAGYEFVVVASVWFFTDIQDAQLYLTPYPHALPDFEEFWPGNSILPLFRALHNLRTRCKCQMVKL
jgi:hypothetical protein